jgi:class 3 adenylate cyclase
MLSTIRAKLLLWFLFFICFSLVIVLISSFYIRERNKISDFREKIEVLHATSLQQVKAQHDFLYFEPTNTSFFLNGTSAFIGDNDSLSRESLGMLRSLKAHSFSSEYQLNSQLSNLELQLSELDRVFAETVENLRLRGFKDYGIDGRMRFFAHQMEGLSVFALNDVLMLRRHEKDYIIRNDQRYVFELLELGERMKEDIRSSKIRESLKDSSLYLLDNYLMAFNDLVEADLKLGMKQRIGLRKKMDDQTASIEDLLASINHHVYQEEAALKDRLRNLYILVITFLLLASVLISFLVSGSISRPIKQLTSHLGTFVKGGFRPVPRVPLKRLAREVALLEENFNVLEKEIISHIDHFKQKVDERTAELATVNERLVRINQANSLFVPNEFLEFLGHKSIEDVALGDHVQMNMTVLFVDIRSFSSLSEVMSPKDNFSFINGYLSRIGPEIRRCGGIIDKFIGDGVMALFPNRPDDALLAARGIIEKVEEYNAFRATLGYTRAISVGIGIHKGNMILGTIGEHGRIDTTVISDAVNVAARLESLTKYYHTVCLTSGDVINELENPEGFQFRKVDTVKVHGKEIPVDVYEALDMLDSSQKKLRLMTRGLFELGVSNALNKDFDLAKEEFTQVLKENPDDETAQMLKNRCVLMKENRQQENWDGITRLAKV